MSWIGAVDFDVIITRRSAVTTMMSWNLVEFKRVGLMYNIVKLWVSLVMEMIQVLIVRSEAHARVSGFVANYPEKREAYE